MPEGVEEQILKGMYLLKSGGKGDKKVQLMGSGTILQEVIAGAELLKADFGVEADIWSCPSFNQLHRDAIEYERHLLNPLMKWSAITACTRWKQPKCRSLLLS